MEYDLLLCCSVENCKITMFGCNLDEQESDVLDVCEVSIHKYYTQIRYNYTVTKVF